MIYYSLVITFWDNTIVRILMLYLMIIVILIRNSKTAMLSTFRLSNNSYDYHIVFKSLSHILVSILSIIVFIGIIILLLYSD